MTHDQRFEEYYQQLVHAAEIIGLTQSMQLGLIMADGNNHACLKSLPERLDPAVTACVVNNHDFAEACRVIREFDERQHSSGLPDAPQKKSVKRVQKHKEEDEQDQVDENKDFQCFNCGNSGHTAMNCKLEACGYCRQFAVGHTSSNCPLRIKGKKPKVEPIKVSKKKKVSSQKAKKKPRSESEEEDEEEDNTSRTPDSNHRHAGEGSKQKRIRVVHRWGQNCDYREPYEVLSSDGDYDYVSYSDS